MPLKIELSIVGKISDIFNTQKPKAQNSRQAYMRKRHWVLGTAVILAGSWITHTTTATIATPEQVASSNIASPENLLSYNIDHAINAQNNLVAFVGISPSFAMTSLPDVTPPNVALLTSPTNALVQLPDAIPEEVFASVKHKVKKGESLGIIFRKMSLDMSLPHKISQHETAKQLVSLSIGKELVFKFDGAQKLREINYPVGALERLEVKLEDNDIAMANIETLPFTTGQKTVSADIESSLYLSALNSGLSNNLIMEMIRIFGWDVDFVLDIRKGDSFHVIYTEHSMDGQKLADGDILAAEFTTQGQTYRAIRFQDNEGNASFYTPEGKSMLGTFLRSPVEFSRISSRFGKRKHPISKKWKAHNGVDYAASRGTPVRATADGKVVLAGRKGGYGNTVVISHAGRFSTLYAHMKGFAKQVRSGSRVKQGQIIGYVGSTGYSTGPHLHYEFRVDGVHRNSLTYKTPKASSIKDELKAEFMLLASNMSEQLNKAENDYQLAKYSGSSERQNKSLSKAAL
jgi:murein DD-endopeptidase MepM/ murein hydrolase activator NlpD